jgi:hypothetical protein
MPADAVVAGQQPEVFAELHLGQADLRAFDARQVGMHVVDDRALELVAGRTRTGLRLIVVLLQIHSLMGWDEEPAP